MPSANALDLPPIGHRYTAGARPLYLHRAGTGEPAVVFLPGGGMFGLGYFNVHMRVAQFTTSVVYDRAGETARERGDASALESLLRTAKSP